MMMMMILVRLPHQPNVQDRQPREKVPVGGLLLLDPVEAVMREEVSVGVEQQKVDG